MSTEVYKDHKPHMPLFSTSLHMPFQSEDEMEWATDKKQAKSKTEYRMSYILTYIAHWLDTWILFLKFLTKILP